MLTIDGVTPRPSFVALLGLLGNPAGTTPTNSSASVVVPLRIRLGGNSQDNTCFGFDGGSDAYPGEGSLGAGFDWNFEVYSMDECGFRTDPGSYACP